MEISERGNIRKRNIDFYIGIPISLVLSFFSFKRKDLVVNRIGIMIIGAIGDALLASTIIPAIRLKYKESHIVLILSQSNSGVRDLILGFDEVCILSLSNPISACIVIARLKLDLIIDTAQWARISGVLSFFSGASKRVGFLTDGQYRDGPYTHTVQHDHSIHELENFRQLAVTAGGVISDESPLINSPPMEICANFNKYIVIHPWAAGYKWYLREWPNESWKKIALHYIANGYEVLISGGASDVLRAEKLCDFIDEKGVQTIAGKYRLYDLAAILLGSQCLISVNTGIMHLAALIGGNVVALNGPTNSIRWGGEGINAVNIDVPKEHGGAYLNLGFEYPKNAPNVMPTISVEQVINAVNIQIHKRKI